MKQMKQDELVWYQGENFAKNTKKIAHGFTSRLGGISQGDLSSLNLGTNRGDNPAYVAENYQRIHKALDISPIAFARNAQVHGNIIHRITPENSHKFQDFLSPDCPVLAGDGLITDCSQIILWVYSADCVPILFSDPKQGVIAALHGGWRGTAMNISAAMIDKMVTEFSSLRENIQVVIGPSIKFCCFTCDIDVVEAMEQSFGTEALRYCPPHPTEKNKFSVDLQGLHVLALQRAGVCQIESSAPCTACHTDTFWSHRKMGEARGIQGGFIYQS